MDTFETIKALIVRKFSIEPARITADFALKTLDIDSLGVFDLLFDVEDATGITVPNEQICVGTVRDVVELTDWLRSEQGMA